MKSPFQNVKGIIFILILLSIVDLVGFVQVNRLWGRILFIAVSIFNIILLAVLSIILKKVLRQSANKEKQYRELLDLSPEAIYVHRKGTIIYSNDAGAKLFGYNEPLELLNRPWKEVLDPKSYESLKVSSKKYETDQQFKVHRFNLFRVDGSARYVEAKSTYIDFDGEPAREVIARDITVQENNRKMLKEFSYSDTLTQLPNRRSLLEQLNQIIEDSKRNQMSFGIMFIDLDGFKQINDTYGHEKGDLLLKQVSEYLSLCVRDEDVVARFGGDEFIIVLPDAYQADCTLIAEKIILHHNLPLINSGYDTKVTLSIGISLYPENGEDARTLIKHADEAMYQAKKRGKNNYQLFEMETIN